MGPANGEFPLFDPSALEELRKVAPPGSDLVARVARTWLRDAPQRVEEARRAVAAGDREAAHRAVHSLKSTSATVGAIRLAEACREVEKEYGAGRVDAGPLKEVERLQNESAREIQGIPELSASSR